MGTPLRWALPALLVTSLAAGCGSEEERAAPGAQLGAGPVAQATATPSAPAKPGPAPALEAAEIDRRLATAEKRARRSEAARADREIARLRRQGRERIARANAAVARRTAVALAEAMHYGTPGVSVADGGRTVTVSVAGERACAAAPDGPASLAARLTAALPFVDDVALVAGGSPVAPSSCAFAALPGGTKVTSATGSGPAETAPFHVGRGRWEVDFGTSGTFLEVLVLQDAELLDGHATRHGSGSGRLVFSGPGTYTLRVAGDGPWAVQVRRASR